MYDARKTKLQLRSHKAQKLYANMTVCKQH